MADGENLIPFPPERERHKEALSHELERFRESMVQYGRQLIEIAKRRHPSDSGAIQTENLYGASRIWARVIHNFHLVQPLNLREQIIFTPVEPIDAYHIEERIGGDRVTYDFELQETEPVTLLSATPEKIIMYDRGRSRMPLPGPDGRVMDAPITRGRLPPDTFLRFQTSHYMEAFYLHLDDVAINLCQGGKLAVK